MSTQTSSVVSLQAPKDVSVSQVEAELSKIWQSYGENSAARATTFNLLVYEPTSMGAASRMASVDAIASQSPCRVIDLVTLDEEDQGISAQVAAYCPIQKSRSSLICGEYITLTGAKPAFERVHSIVPELLIPDLPVFLWWKESPAPNTRMFEKMVNLSDRLIVDSATFGESEADLTKIQGMIKSSVQIADLNWQRLAPWQELTAQAFDQPDRRAAVWEIDGITIDYERGNSTQALMFLGWIASRLGWSPLERSLEGGDYNIQHITFEGRDNIKIKAELAEIPVGDVGEVVGDLIGLRLTASNQNTDACNVFCSESTGCMRMEAGGGAQNYRVHQVSPLSDQSADTLLGKQLQHWGRDVLYEESLTLAAKIIAL
jgi:glucose-6-phosphate dehydrogenase assembly protein OpcA